MRKAPHITLLFFVFSAQFYAFAQEQKRDPFIPIVDDAGNLRRNFKKPQVEELATKVSLNGISKIKGVFYAIIGGNLLKEGDMLNELKIKKIEQNRVILGLGDKEFELQLETEKNNAEKYE